MATGEVNCWSETVTQQPVLYTMKTSAQSFLFGSFRNPLFDVNNRTDCRWAIKIKSTSYIMCIRKHNGNVCFIVCAWTSPDTLLSISIYFLSSSPLYRAEQYDSVKTKTTILRFIATMRIGTRPIKNDFSGRDSRNGPCALVLDEIIWLASSFMYRILVQNKATQSYTSSRKNSTVPSLIYKDPRDHVEKRQNDSPWNWYEECR